MAQIDNAAIYPVLATPVGTDILLGYRPTGSDPMDRFLVSTLPFVAASQLVGTKNRVINGYPFVDQRNSGASQTITASAALAYTVDRWYAYCTGANVTGQQVQVNGLYRYRFTGAASVTAVGFGQRIEARNCADLAGATATLQVKLSSSALTSITWTAYYATTADTFGTLASPTRTSTGTGTFTITATEATYSAQIAISASAITGIEIVFTGGALVASQTLTIGDVQLEAGSALTPFERKQIGDELLLAQRYFNQMSGASYTLCTGLSYSTVNSNGSIDFPVQMRAMPTILVLNQTDFIVTNGALSGISTTSAGSLYVSQFGFEFTVAVASGLTAGQASLLRTGSGGIGKIQISAEL